MYFVKNIYIYLCSFYSFYQYLLEEKEDEPINEAVR